VETERDQVDPLMYERFYGLRERPFELTPNPRYLFLTPRHSEALTMLLYGSGRRNGLTLLIGDAGTGKTTLVHRTLEAQRGGNAFSVYMTNPALTRGEFFEFLAWGFGLSSDARTSKSRFLLDLTRSLVDREASSGVSALIIDEAQCLSDELLEEVRLLSNIESATEKLLSIILIGQPELADRLNAPSMRQLKQRVALRCTLSALNVDETAAYIDTRIRVAGGEWTSIFTRSAVEAIHRGSRGIPRTISVICENALISGLALERRPIGPDIVDEVCRDFDIQAAPDPLAAPAHEDERPRPFSFF
jgi:type II secretory pathway predicted ATPase ExeA